MPFCVPWSVQELHVRHVLEPSQQSRGADSICRKVKVFT